MTGTVVVITDLDGTLLDYYTYSHELSEEGMDLLRRRNIPLIFCTSKSYAEVIYFREKTGNTSPFIVENGGALYIPEGHFGQQEQFQQRERHDGYIVVELGAGYDKVRSVFEQMKRAFDNKMTGFGDMSVGKVASSLNLSPELAGMAKMRRHDEPFLLDDASLLGRVQRFAGQHGLRVYAGTRFYHLMGDTDKGAAVKALVSIYRKMCDTLTTAAVGEGRNDEPMLREVDMPYLVKRPDGTHVNIEVPGITRIDGIGPDGFTRAVKELLERLAPRGRPEP